MLLSYKKHEIIYIHFLYLNCNLHSISTEGDPARTHREALGVPCGVQGNAWEMLWAGPGEVLGRSWGGPREALEASALLMSVQLQSRTLSIDGEMSTCQLSGCC